SDGALVEVDAPDDQIREIAGGFAEKVDGAFDRIRPLLVKTCGPIAEAFREIGGRMKVEQAEVELGLGIEGEGNLFVTKSKAKANIRVKMVLKPGE
ncbi:MAG: hypothetical protein GY859_00075, partial [Desulfobacterales bacterium]|nr:hypothetical protein [Desulfobacterales bacterium]